MSRCLPNRRCAAAAACVGVLWLMGGCDTLQSMVQGDAPPPASGASGAPLPGWGLPEPAASAAAPAAPARASAADAAALTSAATAKASTAATAVTAAELDPGYRIGPEDALDIAVWKEDALKASVVVRPDGGISFPLAGDVHVAGLTAEQVRAGIALRLQRYMPDPEVTVTVARVASYKVFVLGRVNKPGEFTLGRPVDVLQALALAGGLTPFADEGGLRIVRHRDGRSMTLPFDYSRVRKGGDLAQNITLQSGDVLFVP